MDPLHLLWIIPVCVLVGLAGLAGGLGLRCLRGRATGSTGLSITNAPQIRTFRAYIAFFDPEKIIIGSRSIPELFFPPTSMGDMPVVSGLDSHFALAVSNKAALLAPEKPIIDPF